MLELDIHAKQPSRHINSTHVYINIHMSNVNIVTSAYHTNDYNSLQYWPTDDQVKRNYAR